MNVWENAVITVKGLSLLAKLVEGNTLNISKAETGEGYVTPGLLSQQTAVQAPKQTLTFRNVSYPEEGKCKLTCFLTNDDLATGYTASQVGIYANDPDEGEILFCIMQAISGKGTEVPSKSEMPGYSSEWVVYFKYGQADGVTVTIDPSGAVTQEYVNEALKTKVDIDLSNISNPEVARKNLGVMSETEIKTALLGKADADHTHTKSEVGLGNVDNTSDLNKPLSTAAKNALNLKANISLDNVDPDTIRAKIDELKWSSATMSSSGAWCSVAYGNGMFVAIDANPAVAYSEDVINWTDVELPESVDCGDIAYGNGVFVIIGRSQTFAYSYDGISWQPATISVLANWDHITYGNGKFIVVAYNSKQVAYSNDGINWAIASLPVKAYWTGIAYGDGRYVAISNSSGTAAYSDDGISWTQSSLPSIESADWESITYGNGKFVAILYSSNIVAYSKDGINWNTTELPVSKFWKEVAYGNGKFVAIASSADVYVCSNDGISWSLLPLSVVNEPWNTIAYGNGKFVVVAQDSDVVLYAPMQFANAVDVEKTVKNLGGILLWENASPSSAFPSQTIPIDLSGYRRIELKMYGSTGGGALHYGICEIGETCYVAGIDSGKTYYATFTPTPSGVDFVNASGNSTNDYNIPYQIIGYKY